jgi:DUF1365 family protein
MIEAKSVTMTVRLDVTTEETTADQEEMIVVVMCTKKNAPTVLAFQELQVQDVMKVVDKTLKMMVEVATDRDSTVMVEATADHQEEKVAVGINLVSIGKRDHSAKTA